MRSVARRLPRLQRGQGHERLVGRADGIGAVQRRLISGWSGDSFQAAPILDVDAVDEQVGIERGLRNERQDFAGIGIERHQRAAPPLEGLFRQLLQPRSIDSMMSEPGTGSMRRKVRMGVRRP